MGGGKIPSPPLNDCFLHLSSLKVPTKATYIPPAMLIYLPDPLNFLVWSLTLSVCTKLKSVQKGRNAKRGVGVQGAKFFFEVGPKKEKCKKGGGCEAAPHQR